jgi:thiol-disulfide isomerase/thioredoxin
MRSSRLVLCLALVACTQRKEPPVKHTRYEAVRPTAPASSGWCDVTYGATPPRLTLPPLLPASAGAQVPGLPANKRVWVNLWATWCGPCLRELPQLLTWQRDLRKDGIEVELLLPSLDDDAATLSKFLAEHKEIPAASVARVTSQDAYEKWIAAYAKNPAAAIPIHLLAGADGNARCLRLGALREDGYAAVRSLLRE